MLHDNWGDGPGSSVFTSLAADAWEKLSALVGADRVKPQRWVPTLMDAPTQPAVDDQTYLWAYGTGPGWNPTTLKWIVESQNYAQNGSRAVFQQLFGSWLWEWNAADSLLRAVLASAGHGLVSAWGSSRGISPEWHFHQMAMGETIGFGTRLTQNGVYDNNAPSNPLAALMGDPTLRMHVVAPPRNMAASPGAAGGVTLTWTASTDPDVVGYTVYRKAGGNWTRVSGGSYVRATSFTDPAGSYGVDAYMVRAVKPEDTGYGGVSKYYNASQGVFVNTASPWGYWASSDWVSGGNWQGVYGSEGYAMAGNATTVSSAVLSVGGAATTTWSDPSSDPRALRRPDSAQRVAAAYEAPTSFTVDLNFSDTDTHLVSLYFLDWDAMGRNQRVEVLDPVTSQSIFQVDVGNFATGVYYSLNISGSVRLRISSLTPGTSAVLSGIFLDPGW
jgi:hypothetical protein